MNKLNKSGENLSPCATPVFCSISFDKKSSSRICWKLRFSTDCVLRIMVPVRFFVVNEAGIVFATAADVTLDCSCQVRNCVDC